MEPETRNTAAAEAVAELKSKRFEYVAYDAIATTNQQAFKSMFQELEHHVVQSLRPGRAQALVLTKLEEAYMWVGKAIRDEQIARSGGTAGQPARDPGPSPEHAGV